MDSHQQVIAIAGPAHVIRHGLTSIVREFLPWLRILYFNDMQSLLNSFNHQDISVVIIDASIIDGSQKNIILLKKEHSNTALIAFQYQFLSNSILSQFDDIITIDQQDSEIASTIKKAISKFNDPADESKTENLSDRETDVLKLLVTGLSGKEIADKLNISVNTVISHRKNISQKTGIKSLAGLTIYAVANKVISMGSLQK